MARKKLSYREKIEQIGNKLTNLALDMEKQAKEEGHLSPTMGNAVTNALRSSAEIFKYLDSLGVQAEVSGEGDLSPESRAKLDELCKLLKAKEG